jgi:hypothetical protein
MCHRAEDMTGQRRIANLVGKLDGEIERLSCFLLSAVIKGHPADQVCSLAGCGKQLPFDSITSVRSRQGLKDIGIEVLRESSTRVASAMALVEPRELSDHVADCKYISLAKSRRCTNIGYSARSD